MFSPYDIERAKVYMRAEGETQETITEFLEMSAEYLRDAGVEETKSTSARYKLALRAVALHFYDNRDAGEDVPDMPRNTQRLINQLKMVSL